VLSDFRLFFGQKICPLFHQNDPDPHQKSPKTQNILQIRSKNHQNREGAVFESVGFDDFWVEFAKYFVFLGIFHGDRGRFYEKMERFCQKKSKIVKYHCSLLSTVVTFWSNALDSQSEASESEYRILRCIIYLSFLLHKLAVLTT
jgi:hypothetical protein